MKNKMYKRIYSMARPHLKTIVIVTILSILVNIGELIKPYLIKIVLDDYLSKGIFIKGAVTIGMIGAAYIAIVLIGNIIDFTAKTATNFMGEEIIYRLRNRLYKHIQHVNISFHDKNPAGKLFVRMTSDIEDVSDLFKDVITNALKDIILIIAIIIMMICLSIQLSWLSLIIVPFATVISYFFTKILKKIHEKTKNINTKLNTFLAEAIYGIKLIKIFNIQKEKQKHCEDLTKEYLKERRWAGSIGSTPPGVVVIAENIGTALIIWACMEQLFGLGLDVRTYFRFCKLFKTNI